MIRNMEYFRGTRTQRKGRIQECGRKKGKNKEGAMAGARMSRTTGRDDSMLISVQITNFLKVIARRKKALGLDLTFGRSTGV